MWKKKVMIYQKNIIWQSQPNCGLNVLIELSYDQNCSNS